MAVERGGRAGERVLEPTVDEGVRMATYVSLYRVHVPPLCDQGLAAVDAVSGRIGPADGTDAAVPASGAVGRRLDATVDGRSTGRGV